MIDITIKTIDEINILIQKYLNILELIKYKENIPYLALIFDIGVSHINEKYSGMTSDCKGWAMFILNELFYNINNDSDVKEIIDQFIIYYNNEYEKYLNDIVMFTTEYDRDFGFALNFIKYKKIGN